MTFKSRPEGDEEVKHMDIWMIQWYTKEWKRLSASLKYLRIQERLRAVRGMRSFAGTLWRPNTPAPLI